MFPISDSVRAPRFPFITFSFILLTVYIFIQQLLADDQIAFIQYNALIPVNVDFSDISTLIPFVSSIFLHGGILHILSNMWFLWIFGDNVEGYLPPPAYILLYLLAGIVGNLTQFLFMTVSSIPMVGASGAVAGILGCYYVLFPHSKIRTLVIIFFFVTIIKIAAPIMLGYWFILQVISGVFSTPTVGNEGGVAFWAHVAGFIVGIFFGMIFKSYVHNRQAREGEIIA